MNDVPPSPFHLVQEHGEIRGEPWRVLVACVLCNRTSGRRALPVLLEVLARWSTPERLSAVDVVILADVLRPLGLQRRRARTLIELSIAFLSWDEVDVTDLPGVGPYAADAWALFVEGRTDVLPTDRELRRWLDWRTGCVPG